MDVRGKKVVVVGMGQTALALARLLLREQARPFVSDATNNSAVQEIARQLSSLGVEFELGGHTDRGFADAELIIPSPGVPPSIAQIMRAKNRGAEVLGEMEFAFGYCNSRILAVSGTNGKTTTTELLRTLVAACNYSVVLAGNNAFPFSAAVMMSPAPEYIVLEVSSYQLETARTFRPWIATVLNITPDHLARHGSTEIYTEIKSRIFARQQPGDIAVLNRDDERVRAISTPVGVTRVQFSLREMVSEGVWFDGEAFRSGQQVIATKADTRLRGRHNYENICAALTMTRAAGFPFDAALRGLREFRAVEHRIEPVTTIDGVAYFNDSKSTNIDSLRVALETFEVPVVLIAGGRGKGADYRVLRDLMIRRVKRLIAIGEDAPLLEAAFADVIVLERAGDMQDAVHRAAAAAAPGDVVLLSPACASFDMFDNYEHRGRVFKECVLRSTEGLLR